MFHEWLSFYYRSDICSKPGDASRDTALPCGLRRSIRPVSVCFVLNRFIIITVLSASGPSSSHPERTYQEGKYA